jgi:hypothetical protein
MHVRVARRRAHDHRDQARPSRPAGRRIRLELEHQSLAMTVVTRFELLADGRANVLGT